MRKSSFIAALIFVAIAARDGAAQPLQGAKPKPDATPATISANAAADLKSGDFTKMRAALDEIRMAGKGPGARFSPEISELLQKGLPLSLTEAAIDTLGDLESESASATIAPYARHRNVKIRQASMRALGKTKGKAASTALRGGLSDSDPGVRGLAANALGAIKAKEAVGDLFVALDHRVNEAAAAIGLLCSPDECEKLAAQVKKYPFDVVTSGLDQALFRTDISDDTKIRIVGQVRELGTQEANKFLVDIFKRMEKASERLKQALGQAVQATGGGR